MKTLSILLFFFFLAFQFVNPAYAASCSYSVNPTSPGPNRTFTISFSNLKGSITAYDLKFTDLKKIYTLVKSGGTTTGSVEITEGLPSAKTWGFTLTNSSDRRDTCDGSVQAISGGGGGAVAGKTFCKDKDGNLIKDKDGNPIEGVETQLGCIPTSAQGFAGWFLNIGIALGTLLAILFIIIGGYKVMTSGGDPDMIADGKEQITAAVAGLVFILASVLILSIIGVQIIGIDPKLFGF